MEALLADQDAERERHVRHIVSTLKSLAETTEGGNPRQAVERVGAKLIAHGLQALQPQPVKQAAAHPRQAIALAAMVEKKLGPMAVGYDPAMLLEAGFTPAEVTRLMGAYLVLYEVAPFVHWHVFEKIACALNERDVLFDVTQDLSPAEVAWACDAMRYIDEATPWSHEVAAYVAGILHQAGFVVTPTPLAFAGPVLERLASDEGHAVAARVAAGEQDLACRIQRQRLAEVMAYVNERHARLDAELKKV